MVDEPRWKEEPAPGFKPDGTSMIVASIDEVKYPDTKIEVDGKSYSPEEYEALLAERSKDEAVSGENNPEGDSDDDDFSDLDDLDALADSGG